MPYKDKTSPEAKASNARRNKKYYDKNKESIIAYKKEHYKSYFERNKDKWKVYNQRSSAARRKRMFGIDDETYQQMLVKQKNKCAICGIHKDELKYTLCVDHDHSTGKVRGLLCHGCNNGIGKMKDNIQTIKNAIKYLTN